LTPLLDPVHREPDEPNPDLLDGVEMKMLFLAAYPCLGTSAQ